MALHPASPPMRLMMSSYRIDTITDPGSGYVLAEILRELRGELIAQSGPICASHAKAEELILDAISKAWPTQPVDPVYPANGS